jgi:hypothetical protein
VEDFMLFFFKYYVGYGSLLVFGSYGGS